MEIAGRAGGLIPTNTIVLRDVVLLGGRDARVLQGGRPRARRAVVDELWELSRDPADVFLSRPTPASTGRSSGLALRAKETATPSSR